MADDDTLTIDKILSVMRRLERPVPDPFGFAPLTVSGMRIIEAPERPVLQMDPNFKWCSDECRAEMNLWLLEMFGTRSIVPKDTVYMFHNSFVMRPEHAVMLRNVTA